MKLNEVIYLKQLFSFVIQTEEDKVVIHIEVEKEKFKKYVDPLLLVGLQYFGKGKQSIPPPSIIPTPSEQPKQEVANKEDLSEGLKE